MRHPASAPVKEGVATPGCIKHGAGLACFSTWNFQCEWEGGGRGESDVLLAIAIKCRQEISNKCIFLGLNTGGSQEALLLLKWRCRDFWSLARCGLDSLNILSLDPRRTKGAWGLLSWPSFYSMQLESTGLLKWKIKNVGPRKSLSSTGNE